LKVGQGDSIVVNFPDESWAVIDSNIPPGQETPPALQLLRHHHVKKLFFVCLTHPHADHFTGLAQVLESFEGQIDEFWGFPVDSQHRRTYLETFLRRQHEKNSAGGQTGWSRYNELETIFRTLHKMERAGSGQYLIGGVSVSKAGVEIECLSPLSADLNQYQSALARSKSTTDYDADGRLLIPDLCD
jgi:hypothetical protein